MPEILEVKNLTKLFTSGQRKVCAVDGVSFCFEAGKSYAITGPSGCGKSTLLNMIGLILQPTEGQVTIQAKNSAELGAGGRARLRNSYFGYIAQNFLLVDGYSVSENISIPLLYRKPRLSAAQRRQCVQQAVDRVNLGGMLTENTENLSGGQRQRVAIARALVNEPTVILADEPTGSLDSQTGTEIFELLLSLAQAGKTLIMVTHNPQLAQRCSCQIKMLDGKIAEEKAPLRNKGPIEPAVVNGPGNHR